MCDCGINIYNEPDDNLYDCDNIGSGLGIYSGADIVPTATIFEFKSLKAGTNVNLISDADSITISSTDTGVTTLSNNGGGAAVGQNITGSTLNLRTITATGAVTVTQNPNTLAFNSNAPTSVSNVGIGTAQVGNGITAGNVLQLKTISASNGVAVSQSTDTIFLTNNMVVSNNGGGQGLLMNNIGGILNAKTLVAGTNVSLSSTANTVTINSTASGVTTLSNNGTGAAVGQLIVGNTLNLRTLVGTNGLSINASGNEVTLSNDQIQSINNVIIYNYGKSRLNIFKDSSYFSPTGATSNNIPIVEYVAGSIVNTGLTTADYFPGPRYPFATFVPFTTVANNGTTNASFFKLQPNTLYANDQVKDFVLGLTNDNNLYQLDMDTLTENKMKKLNGSLLFLSPTPTLIAMDIEDNILFFASNEDVYFYDFSLDTTTFLFNVNSFTNWAGNLRYMYYARSTLYLLDKDYDYFLISITPYDRYSSTTLCYGTAQGYKYFFNGDMYTFSINPETGLPLITNFNGPTRISSGSMFGASDTGTEFGFNILENNNSIYLTIPAASGRIYVHSPDTLAVYRYDYGSSIGSSPTSIWTTSNRYISWTRTPYGILA